MVAPTRRLSRLVAGAAILAITAGAAAPGLAHADKKQQPREGAPCVPGGMTWDEAGKVTHVCDKNGKWVKVLRFEAGPLRIVASAPMAQVVAS